MIRFEKLRWKNLLSTGQYFTEIDLTKANTTLICGENGAGKSTMLDALCFVLFGKPYRNINLPQLVNSINQKDSVVEIEFTIGKDSYKVIRGQAPKLFEVHKNGKLIDQEAKSKDYQRMFEEQILRMNYKSFCQVVILGSANYVPFMRLVAAERRSIVETILDINIFSTMNVILKGKVSQNREELVELEGKIAVLKERISLQKKYMEEKTKDEKDIVEKYQTEINEALERIETIKKELSDHQQHLSEYLEKIDDKPLIESNKANLDSLQKQLTTKIKSLNTSIDFYEKNDTCPTCTQSIGSDFKESAKSGLASKKREVETAMEEIGKQMTKVAERMEELRETVLAMKEIESDINDCKNELSMQKKFIDKTKQKLEEAKAPKTDDSKEKEEFAKSIADEAELVSSRNELVDTQYYYGVASTLLKDSGIKSRIIKHYIPVINKVINQYLTQMGLFVNFNLDEEFNETILSRHRDTFTYASFSEGEKKKIDLALLFAWRAIAQMKNSVSTNLLILDEVLDGSLDDAASESFLDLLKGLDNDTNVFVISHKPKELLESKFSRLLTFVKRNNFSSIASTKA
jgi:DNA repair exonuclease SbcCD ATPase subunit